MSDTIDTLEIQVVSSAEPALKSLQDMQKQLQGLGNQMKSAMPNSNGFAESLKKMGETLQGIGGKMTSAGKALAPLSTALAGVGAISIKTAADFEAQMSKVQAISGASTKDMDKLSASAKEWGANSKFSATEAGQAFEYMGMAGWKTDQMLAGIPGILNLAAASGEDLGKTSDIVTDSLSAFGLTASDSAHFADVLAAASTNANTNVSMLGNSFKYAAPVAGALGFSVEDTTEALGLMANSGIKASSAGTSLRSLMNTLTKDVKLSGSAFGEMTIATQNSDGTMRSLGDILTDLRGAFGQMTEAEKASAAQTLVGKNAMSGFLTLMNAAPADIDKLNSAIGNCDGVAADMATTMQDNLNGSLTSLKSKLEAVQIVIGETLMPIAKQFVDSLTALADRFLSLDPAVQTTITAFGAVAAAAAPVLLLGGKITTMVGGTMTAFSGLVSGSGALSSAFTALTGPMGLVVAAAAAFTAGMAVTAATNDKVKAALSGLADGFNNTLKPAITELAGTVLSDLQAGWQRLQEIIQPLKDFISGVFASAWTNILIPALQAVMDAATGLVGVLQNIWNNVLVPLASFVASVLEPAFAVLADGLQVLWDNILVPVAGFLIGTFSTAWKAIETVLNSVVIPIFSELISELQSLWDNVLKPVASWITGTFGPVFKTIATIVGNVINTVTNIITGIPNTVSNIVQKLAGLFNSFLSTVQSIWTGIGNAVKVAVMFVVEVIKGAFSLITLPFRFIWENCSDTILSVWSKIKNAVSTAINTVKTTISTVMNAIKTAFSVAWNAIKTTITTVVNAISSTISTVWNAIKTAVTTVVNAIKTAVTNAFNAVKSTVTTIFNAIKSTATTVWNSVKSAVSGPVNAIKSTVSSVFNSVKSTVTTIWNNIKTAISKPINAAKDTVKTAIAKIKGFFNFSWSLPKLKMPHFNISGKFSLNPPSVPKFGIEWYAKGGILNGAQIFGASGGKFLGGGEAGKEAVLPLSELWKQIRVIMSDLLIEYSSTNGIEKGLFRIADVLSGLENIGHIATSEQQSGYIPVSETTFNHYVSNVHNTQNAVTQNYDSASPGIVSNSVFPAVYDAVSAAIRNNQPSGNGNAGGQAPVVEITLVCDSETIFKLARKGQMQYDGRYKVETAF